MIGELSDKQSDVKELLAELREGVPDSSTQFLASDVGWHDDLIVAIVLTRMEMVSPPRHPEMMDLIWAGEFLDHMDTQGFHLVRK